ncbi:hypothetical protein N8264_03755 [Candidatus Thioglobus sp.]|nr:hypothetical protein [Candidatus Thioglobus sp.]
MHFKNSLSLLYQSLLMLENCFKHTHQDWGSVGGRNHLGSQNKLSSFVGLVDKVSTSIQMIVFRYHL